MRNRSRALPSLAIRRFATDQMTELRALMAEGEPSLRGSASTRVDVSIPVSLDDEYFPLPDVNSHRRVRYGGESTDLAIELKYRTAVAGTYVANMVGEHVRLRTDHRT